MPCHSVADVLPGMGRLGSTPCGADRHAPVSEVVDVALHRGDHDVLRHQLPVRQGLLHFGQVSCRHHFIALVGQADLVGVGNGHRVGLAVLAGHDRPVM